MNQSSQSKLLESFEGGEIAIQDHKYRLTLPGQEVINNGQTVWTYLTEANEVQITELDPEQTVAAPWAVLANYHQDYVLLNFGTQEIRGQVYDVMDLLSKDERNALPKITLTIERSTKHIKRLETMDSNQTLHIFFITDFEYDPQFDKAFFYFNTDEHKEVEIIDLR